MGWTHRPQGSGAQRKLRAGGAELGLFRPLGICFETLILVLSFLGLNLGLALVGRYSTA